MDSAGKPSHRRGAPANRLSIYLVNLYLGDTDNAMFGDGQAIRIRIMRYYLMNVQSVRGTLLMRAGPIAVGSTNAPAPNRQRCAGHAGRLHRRMKSCCPA